ncbi:MAG: hypothetical protein LBQ75_07675, partial [Zoogloeaceae bacterium]|nr:hypothetical protein [Zoogloeaceae bacterium]
MLQTIRGWIGLCAVCLVLAGMLAGCSDEPQSVATPNVNESQDVEDALNESQDAEDIAKFEETKKAAEKGDA